MGDLVVVIGGHCAADMDNLGRIFRVTEHINNGFSCPCGHVEYSGDGFSSGDKYTFERPWLKRIPPIEELDDVKREEEIEI